MNVFYDSYEAGKCRLLPDADLALLPKRRKGRQQSDAVPMLDSLPPDYLVGLRRYLPHGALNRHQRLHHLRLHRHLPHRRGHHGRPPVPAHQHLLVNHRRACQQDDRTSEDRDKRRLGGSTGFGDEEGIEQQCYPLPKNLWVIVDKKKQSEKNNAVVIKIEVCRVNPNFRGTP